MHRFYYLAYRCQLISTVVALVLASAYSQWASGQAVALNKSNSKSPETSGAISDRKRDGLFGSVRTVLTERVKIDSPSGHPDDARRILVSTEAYDLMGKKIYGSKDFLPTSTLPSGKPTYKYDEKGNAKEMVIRGKDQMVLRKETYAYEYDRLGNWTRKTTYVWLSVGTTMITKPTAVSYRTISYYSDEYGPKQGQQSSTINPAPSPTPVAPKKDSASNDQSKRDGSQGRPNDVAVTQKEIKLDEAVVTTNSASAPDSKPTDRPVTRTISEGVIAGRPIFLPMPRYPDSAKTIGARGSVRVNVIVDEGGNVTSAEVESGPALFRPAALQAAFKSRFTPTLLSGRPTKVNASINYNFIADAPTASASKADGTPKKPASGPASIKDLFTPVKENSNVAVNTGSQQFSLDVAPAPNSNPGLLNDAVIDKPAETVTKAPANSADNTPSTAPDISQVQSAPLNLRVIPPADPKPEVAKDPKPEAANPVAPVPRPVEPESRPLNTIYKVGIGDILDIHVPKIKSGQSTLFTVQGGGILDYPAVGESFIAAGMTTDELSAKIAAELKRRALIDDDKVVVSIRDYASHKVFISGLVDQPGQKVIQREAVPLFVLLAQAAPRPEAGRAVITSATSPAGKIVDLSDPAATGVLVSSGDAINVIARPREFIYVGGEITSPGRKEFHPGVTLTQVLLECGGVVRTNHEKVWVKISRQDSDGRLLTADYNLASIEDGRIPDPSVQAGDRIVAGRER